MCTKAPKMGLFLLQTKSLETLMFQGRADGGTRTRTPVKAVDFKSGKNRFELSQHIQKHVEL